MIDTKDMQALADGRRLVNVMDDIRYEVERQKTAVQNKAFQAIRKKELTPELAQQLWMEIHAADRLLQNFQSRVNTAVSAAEKHTDILTIER